RRARRRAKSCGRKRAQWRPASVVRAVRELSEPQGQRELPATAKRSVRYREQARSLPPFLQQRGAGVQYRHPTISGVAIRWNFWLLATRVFRSRRKPRSARSGTEREVLV